MTNKNHFIKGIIIGVFAVFVYTFLNSIGSSSFLHKPLPWWLILPFLPGLGSIIAGYISKGILKALFAGLLIAILGAFSAMIILDRLLALFVKINDGIPYTFIDTIVGTLEYIALLAIFTVPAGFIGGLISWLQRELFDRKKGLLT